MEHQHHSDMSKKKGIVDHSKMSHNSMQHGTNPAMGMDGYNHSSTATQKIL